jgi:hypothetical protein
MASTLRPTAPSRHDGWTYVRRSRIAARILILLLAAERVVFVLRGSLHDIPSIAGSFRPELPPGSGVNSQQRNPGK